MCFSVINRPLRITKTSATVIDHILTNTILDFEAKHGIIKNDISNHFGIFGALSATLERKKNNEYVMRRDVTESSAKNLELISTVDWNLITQTLNPNGSCNIFIDKFLDENKNSIQPFRFQRESKKSSRKKQRLSKTIRLETIKNL